MARVSLRTVHLVWEGVPGGAQAVCTVGHSKNTAMQDLMTPQDWGPYSGCGCPGHHVRMPVLYVGNGQVRGYAIFGFR